MTWRKIKPWTSVTSVTVVYSDGMARTIKTYCDEKLDYACSEGELLETLEECAGLQRRALDGDKRRTWSKLDRGHSYPLAVVVSLLEAHVSGGRKPDSDDLQDEFETTDNDANAGVFRIYDVAGYMMLHQFELLMNLDEPYRQEIVA